MILAFFIFVLIFQSYIAFYFFRRGYKTNLSLYYLISMIFVCFAVEALIKIINYLTA